MTPEEKAKGLINKFYQLRVYETMSLSGKQAAWGISKESAKILVQEIIEKLNDVWGYDCEVYTESEAYSHSINQEVEWYEKVLSEIDNL